MAATAVNDLLLLSALELARLIREGAVSSATVVEAHIRRLQAVNPTINAVVAERYDAARAEARAADARAAGDHAADAPAAAHAHAHDDPYAPGQHAHCTPAAEHADQSADAGHGAVARALPPLLGVPFTVKEMVSLEGMPHTLGSRVRAGRLAAADATVIARLRAAGAIPLGVTNVPEWGFWFETENLLYGRTRNPYDPSRGAGGSSGGEAAAIGAGASPFGVGSDIGGSLRMPAAFCGIFAHKPTHGLLPLTGHYPVYAAGPEAFLHRESPWLSLGPLARRADDLMPLLRIMSGPDGVDPNAEPLPLGDPEAVQWQGRRVFVLDDPRILGAARASSDVRAATTRAARALAVRGAILEPLPRDLFRHTLRLWLESLRASAPVPLDALLTGGGPLHLPREFARLLAGRPRFTYPALMFAVIDRAGRLRRYDRRSLVRERRRLHHALQRRLGGPDGAVLLMPPHPRPAPRHRAPYLRPFDFTYTAAFNLLRIPATIVPIGLGAGGLPLAVQVAADRGGDHLAIAAALALERDFGGWRPPDAGTGSLPPLAG